MPATATVLDTTALVTCTLAKTMYEVTFPQNARSYDLQFRANAGRLLQKSGTDATTITTENLEQIVGDQVQTRHVPGTDGKARNMVAATRKIWVASASAGTVCEITPYTRTAP